MNWDILQRWKIFHFYWKNFHLIRGKFLTLVEKFPLPKKICIPKSHALEHSAEETFFRKIGNFSTFPIKKKSIPKSHELGHSAELENFPFLLEKLPV